MSPLEFDIIELAFMAGLSSFKSLNNKARKQEWPYIRQQKASGSPVHLYPLSALPDELQIAWAHWDQTKAAQCIQDERGKAERGRPGRVPEPVSYIQAQEALQLRNRLTYYQAPSKDYQVEPSYRRIYDGQSRGLCLAAREVLLERFGQSSASEPAKESLLVRESERVWGLQSPKPLYTAPQPGQGCNTKNTSEPVRPALQFDPQWVEGSLKTNPESLTLLTLTGDSMEPTLKPGDLLLVDRSKQTLKDGLLYAFQVGDNFLVKRIELQLDGSYKLQCDNPKYTEQSYHPDQPDANPVILGRLIWFGREL